MCSLVVASYPTSTYIPYTVYGWQINYYYYYYCYQHSASQPQLSGGLPWPRPVGGGDSLSGYSMHVSAAMKTPSRATGAALAGVFRVH